MGVMASNYESRNGVGTNKRVANVEYVLDLIDAIYPVGSIRMSANNANPGTYFRGTTWVAWGSGRVPVGINTADTDFNTVEKTGGAKTHVLTINQMPSHRHHGDGGPDRTNSPTNLTATGDSGGRNVYTLYAGGNEAHNNLQPYITCYMWKRTA